ncbi:hypothetical protein WICMUC_003091 [Wickerhamomyces mucosus]|uniref:Uncharacterized protein n=1 Tax=Wickerhamomyces mucosus TaxID=1378264 RepID=A0A9P8TDN3_9ASCO|nr:hypothetical protein WICMUC_003091 [Wickerhamomyces mucosus]
MSHEDDENKNNNINQEQEQQQKLEFVNILGYKLLSDAQLESMTEEEFSKFISRTEFYQLQKRLMYFMELFSHEEDEDEDDDNDNDDNDNNNNDNDTDILNQDYQSSMKINIMKFFSQMFDAYKRSTQGLSDIYENLDNLTTLEQMKLMINQLKNFPNDTKTYEQFNKILIKISDRIKLSSKIPFKEIDHDINQLKPVSKRDYQVNIKSNFRYLLNRLTLYHKKLSDYEKRFKTFDRQRRDLLKNLQLKYSIFLQKSKRYIYIAKFSNLKDIGKSANYTAYEHVALIMVQDYSFDISQIIEYIIVDDTISNRLSISQWIDTWELIKIHLLNLDESKVFWFYNLKPNLKLTYILEFHKFVQYDIKLNNLNKFRGYDVFYKLIIFEFLIFIGGKLDYYIEMDKIIMNSVGNN